MSATFWALLLAATVAELVLGRTAILGRAPKLLPWYSGVGRGLLALTAAAVTPESRGILIALALLAAARLATAYLMGVVQPAMRQAVIGVGVAEDYFESFRWADYASRRFGPVVAVMTLAQLLGDLALGIAGLIGDVSPVVYVLVVAYAVVEAGTHVMGIGLWNHHQGAALQAVAAGLAAAGPRVVVYTAALPESAPNLEQWLPALEASGESGYVITRELATVARLAGQTSWPVVYLKALGGLEDLVPRSVEVALYVDTSVRNNHLLRLGGLTHVQLHHGDSDKASSTSRLLRLYDHHLVAGRAAVERLIAAGVIAGPEAATVVGRPIAAGLTRREPNSECPMVLYAPTWEGYHRDNALTSLPAAAALVGELVDAGVRLVVRPHPLTGRVDKAMAAHAVEIESTVAAAPQAAMSTDPSAAAAVAALEQADVLITDVSSMLSDFLYTGRPVLVADIAGRGEDELVAAFPTLAAAYIVRPDGSDLAATLDEALGEDPRRAQREATAREVLGDLDGSGLDFATALARLRRPVEPPELA